MNTLEKTESTKSVAAQPLLKLDKVSAGYDESTILKEVTMEVPENKAVALLGRNGAVSYTHLTLPTNREV